MKYIISILITLIMASTGLADGIKVNMQAIAMIESSGDPQAYNERTNAVGLYQITLPCLADYNQAHILGGYNHEDMFHPSRAHIVASWYINKKIPSYMKYYKIEDSINNRLIAYNWGIGNLRKWVRSERTYKIPKETSDYIVKYNNYINSK